MWKFIQPRTPECLYKAAVHLVVYVHNVSEKLLETKAEACIRSVVLSISITLSINM